MYATAGTAVDGGGGHGTDGVVSAVTLMLPPYTVTSLQVDQGCVSTGTVAGHSTSITKVSRSRAIVGIWRIGGNGTLTASGGSEGIHASTRWKGVLATSR